MGLGDLSAWQWTGAALAAFLVGLSKAGFGAGAGILAVPLMAAALGPVNMLSVMLLVLISGDLFSLVHYPRVHDRRNLAILLPGLLVGVLLGYLALDWFLGLPDADLWMRRVIGFLSVAFVAVQFQRFAQERHAGVRGRPYVPRAWHGVGLGAVAGLTSTLAHAGGPLIVLYLLPQRLDKRLFVGTVIKYFLVGNLAKLMPYFLKGLMTGQNAVLSLALLPLVGAGSLGGIYLHKRFSDRAFRVFVYGLALCFGLYLLSGWQPGRTAPDEGANAFRHGIEAYGSGEWATSAPADAAATTEAAANGQLAANGQSAATGQLAATGGRATTGQGAGVRPGDRSVGEEVLDVVTSRDTGPVLKPASPPVALASQDW